MPFAYHWSPTINHDSIIKRGLLIPKKHPRTTQVVTCSEGHRNPHVSLGMTPIHAWDLSGGFLLRRAREQQLDSAAIPLRWDLWQVDLGKIRNWREDDHEFQSTKDISPGRLIYLATRWT